jgi:hypothetical protein
VRKSLLLLSLLSVVLVARPTGQTATIRASEVKAHLAQLVVVEDEVAQISRGPELGFTCLTFGGSFPNHIFRVVIPGCVENRVERSVLASAWVRVRAVPQHGSGGVPEMVCSDAAQIGAVAGRGSRPVAAPAPSARPCCRVCTTGKACGNNCIARNRTCPQPPGCACNV